MTLLLRHLLPFPSAFTTSKRLCLAVRSENQRHEMATVMQLDFPGERYKIMLLPSLKSQNKHESFISRRSCTFLSERFGSLHLEQPHLWQWINQSCYPNACQQFPRRKCIFPRYSLQCQPRPSFRNSFSSCRIHYRIRPRQHYLPPRSRRYVPRQSSWFGRKLGRFR